MPRSRLGRRGVGLGRYAVVSGGRGAETATEALASLARGASASDLERSLELGARAWCGRRRSPPSPWARQGLERFAEQARGDPAYEAVARIHGAVERLFQGDPAPEAVVEIEAAFAAGLPPSARTNAAFFALTALRVAERYDLASPVLERALERAREEGHTARQGLIHGQRAVIAVEQGDLHDAQVEAETGLLLVDERHFTTVQLLAVAIVVDIERGSLDTAAQLRQRGDLLGIAEDRAFVSEYLIARGRLRIAQGDVSEGVEDLRWCGRRIEAQWMRWPTRMEGVRRARPCRCSGRRGGGEAGRRAARRGSSLRRPRGAGTIVARRRTDTRCRGAMACSSKPYRCSSRSSARLELALRSGGSRRELSAPRRREGRDAQRGRWSWPSSAVRSRWQTRRSELQAGPGRRARIELTGPAALTAAESRVCRQAAEGRTNREIAQALFVTEKTVERHL